MSIKTIVDSLPGKSLGQRARMRENAERLARTGSETQKKDAITLLDALETLARTEEEARETMPLDERVVLAFTRLPATENDAKAIATLLRHPGRTSRELTALCGWGDQYFNRAFGGMCKDRRADLGIGPDSKIRDAEFYSGILADFDHDNKTFTMKPEAARGFARLGLAPASQPGAT